MHTRGEMLAIGAGQEIIALRSCQIFGPAEQECVELVMRPLR